MKFLVHLDLGLKNSVKVGHNIGFDHLIYEIAMGGMELNGIETCLQGIPSRMLIIGDKP